jgi:hypothetical protein
MPAPYLLTCLFRSPDRAGLFVPQHLRVPGDDRDSWIVGRPGWREAGRPTHRCCRSIRGAPSSIAIRNLSGLFRINAAIGGCYVLGNGYHPFSTGPARSLPTRLGHAALAALADDGGSGSEEAGNRYCALLLRILLFSPGQNICRRIMAHVRTDGRSGTHRIGRRTQNDAGRRSQYLFASIMAVVGRGNQPSGSRDAHSCCRV